MFNINEYISTLTVDEDDHVLKDATNLVNLIQLICDDPWLSRQGFFGMAGAMERQIEYLGTTLRPNVESKLLRIQNSTGFLGETDVGSAHFANEDRVHINDERGQDQLVDDQQTFLTQLDERMRVAAIIFIKCVREHDFISAELNQLTYSGIKAKADANRRAREAQPVREAPNPAYAGVA